MRLLALPIAALIGAGAYASDAAAMPRAADLHGLRSSETAITQIQYRRHWRGHRYHGARRGGGWGGAAAGLAAGAIIGGALANSYNNAYAAPQGYVVDDSAVQYCMQRFRSYDPASGTYLGYDGNRHACP